MSELNLYKWINFILIIQILLQKVVMQKFFSLSDRNLKNKIQLKIDITINLNLIDKINLTKNLIGESRLNFNN